MIEEKEMLRLITESVKRSPPTNCDRCGKELDEKFYLRITKVIFKREIVCEGCNIIRDTNSLTIQNALIESLNDLL